LRRRSADFIRARRADHPLSFAIDRIDDYICPLSCSRSTVH
jgi:hypothetical protein